MVIDEPIITYARAVPTITDLLAVAEAMVKQPKEGPSESLIAVSFTFEMIGPPADMEREESQLVPPHETVEPVAPLVEATADKSILKEPIQQDLNSDEPMYDENIA